MVFLKVIRSDSENRIISEDIFSIKSARKNQLNIVMGKKNLHCKTVQKKGMLKLYFMNCQTNHCIFS